MKSVLALFFILSVYLFIAVYRLDEIPGEWFGDISNLHGYVQDIQQGLPAGKAGKWPITYRQGVGPLYHYLITPLVFVTGQRYLGYKLLSVFSGAFSLLGIYFFSTIVTNKKTTLVTTAISAVSFWFLVWARLGNLHAILPGIVSFSFYFLFLYRKTEKFRYLFIGTLIACSGMFWYLGMVMLPIAFFVGVILTRKKNEILKQVQDDNKNIIIVGSIIVVAILLFLWLVMRDTAQFFTNSGYIGEKYLPLFSLDLGLIVKRVVIYIARLLLMLHVRGDHIFRINVPDTPMLDVVSGVLFFLGGWWLFKTKRRLFVVVAVSVFILIIPSIFPSLQPIQIPSSTRTFGITPFVFLLVGVGLTEVGEWVEKKIGKWGRLWMIGVIGIIAILNLHKYFIQYPYYLPNHNYPIGKRIAEYIDTLPSSTMVFLMDCCWGEWGQPEPLGIYMQLKTRTKRENILAPKTDIVCDRIPWGNGVTFVLNPVQKELFAHLTSCRKDTVITRHTDPFGNPMFVTVSLDNRVIKESSYK